MSKNKKCLLDTNAVSALTQEQATDHKKISAQVVSLEVDLYVSILSIYEICE